MKPPSYGSSCKCRTRPSREAQARELNSSDWKLAHLFYQPKKHEWWKFGTRSQETNGPNGFPTVVPFWEMQEARMGARTDFHASTPLADRV